MEVPSRRVICRFCQQTAVLSPLEEMTRMGVDVYWCEKCQAEYLYFQDSDYPNSCSLYATLNNKVYRWTTTATGRVALWYIKTPGIPSKQINRDLICLFSLSMKDNQPTITPENILSKIKTLLVFL